VKSVKSRNVPPGCGVMILGIILLFLLVIPLSIPGSASAVQATQLYSGATMWIGLLIAVGIGLLLLTVDDVRTEVERHLAQAVSTSGAWEFCDLMEGKFRDGQTGKVRQVVELLYHYRTGSKKQPATNLTDALSHLNTAGWDLVSVYAVPYSVSVSEIHWIFKRPAPPQRHISAQEESKAKKKKRIGKHGTPQAL
jgi:hypothetical protein